MWFYSYQLAVCLIRLHGAFTSKTATREKFLPGEVQLHFVDPFYILHCKNDAQTVLGKVHTEMNNYFFVSGRIIFNTQGCNTTCRNT